MKIYEGNVTAIVKGNESGYWNECTANKKKVYLKKGFCLVDKSRMLPTIERTKEKKQNFEINQSHGRKRKRKHNWKTTKMNFIAWYSCERTGWRGNFTIYLETNLAEQIWIYFRLVSIGKRIVLNWFQDWGKMVLHSINNLLVVKKLLHFKTQAGNLGVTHILKYAFKKIGLYLFNKNWVYCH